MGPQWTGSLDTLVRETTRKHYRLDLHVKLIVAHIDAMKHENSVITVLLQCYYMLNLHLNVTVAHTGAEKRHVNSAITLLLQCY